MQTRINCVSYCSNGNCARSDHKTFFGMIKTTCVETFKDSVCSDKRSFPKPEFSPTAQKQSIS